MDTLIVDRARERIITPGSGSWLRTKSEKMHREFWSRVRPLREQGFNLETIAKILNVDCFSLSGNGCTWNRQKVSIHLAVCCEQGLVTVEERQKLNRLSWNRVRATSKAAAKQRYRKIYGVIVESLVSYRRQGQGLKEIAKSLTRDRVTKPYGGHVWTMMGVSRTFRRCVQLGLLTAEQLDRLGISTCLKRRRRRQQASLADAK